MTLEELKVVIKAETKSVDTAIDSLRNDIAGLSSMIDSELSKTDKISKSVASKLRDNFIKELDKLILDTEKRLDKLNDAMQSASKEFGINSPEAEGIGLKSDKLAYYYEYLKKIRDEAGDAFDSSEISNSVNELQQSLDSISGTDAWSRLTSGLDGYLARLEELNSMEHVIMTNSNGNSWDQTDTNIKRVQKSIDKLIERFATLNNMSLDNLVAELEKVGYSGVYSGKTAAPQTSPQSSKGGMAEVGKGITKTFGTFTKALLGVRGLYMLFRKILSNNEYIYSAVNNLVSTISSVLAPILNFIAALISAIANALGNIFKVGKKTSEATGATAKSLASFDEINNVNNSSGGGSSNVDIPSLKEAWEALSGLEKLLVGGALTLAIVGIIKKIVELFQWVGNIIKIVTGFFAGNIWTQIAGIGLIVAGIIVCIQSVIEYLNDPSWKNFGGVLEGIALILAGVAVLFASWPVAIAAAIVAVLGIIATFRDEIDAFINGVCDAIDGAINWIHENITNSGIFIFAAIGSFIEGVLTIVKGLVKGLWQIIDGVVSGLKKILDGIILMFKGDFKNGLKTVWEGIKTMLVGIVQGIWTMIKGVLNAIIGGFENMCNAAIKGLNKLTSGLRNMGNKVLSFLGISSFSFSEMSTIKLPRLATGTNYVPQDMVAMLHKGEAVVPKKYNGATSEETNNLLKQLINVVDSKEFKAYISKNDIGKQAVDYINSQNRIRGGSILA